jgi:hypothetical protein
MRGRREAHTRGALVKGREDSAETLQLQAIERASLNQAVEHLPFIEAVHDDEPIGNGAAAGQGKAAGTDAKRYDALIDGRCEPAIQSKFGPTGRFTAFQCREIQVWKADGFLELVSLVTGEKDPGHVRFTREDARGSLSIGVRPPQKQDLLVKRYVARNGARNGIQVQSCSPPMTAITAGTLRREAPPEKVAAAG